MGWIRTTSSSSSATAAAARSWKREEKNGSTTGALSYENVGPSWRSENERKTHWAFFFFFLSSRCDRPGTPLLLASFSVWGGGKFFHLGSQIPLLAPSCLEEAGGENRCLLALLLPRQCRRRCQEDSCQISPGQPSIFWLSLLSPLRTLALWLFLWRKFFKISQQMSKLSRLGTFVTVKEVFWLFSPRVIVGVHLKSTAYILRANFPAWAHFQAFGAALQKWSSQPFSVARPDRQKRQRPKKDLDDYRLGPFDLLSEGGEARQKERVDFTCNTSAKYHLKKPNL